MILFASLMLILLAAAVDPVAADTGDEEIKWQVTPSGGTVSSSADYFLRGTVGQTAGGRISAEGVGVSQGFWQDFGTSGCCLGALRGNVNYDPQDEVDISDVIFLVDFMFGGGEAPPCFEEADVDADFVVELNIADLVYLVDYMFLSGSALPECR